MYRDSHNLPGFYHLFSHPQVFAGRLKVAGRVVVRKDYASRIEAYCPLEYLSRMYER